MAEFHIPAGKVYPSPTIDFFDGMPIGKTISRSPDARMANSSLLKACEWLGENDRPVIHNDRSCNYRWPGWISICEEHGLVRSMSRKGFGPDNSRAEGFFDRLKIEFLYGRDWSDVTLHEFAYMLDAYMMWYRDEDQERLRLQEPDALPSGAVAGRMRVRKLTGHIEGYDDFEEVQVEVCLMKCCEIRSQTFDVTTFSREELESGSANPHPTITAGIGF